MKSMSTIWCSRRIWTDVIIAPLLYCGVSSSAHFHESLGTSTRGPGNESSWPSKMAMDFFSRQRSVPDWEQTLIEQQKALVLGVGAIGCSVSRNLCRLGISELAMVDCDTVAASNVNRQVLYATGDVGRKKVEAALDGLDRDRIQTKVTAHHYNAVTDWRRTAELARNSTVVFNCIDYGEYFDCAVTSLCISLGIHYVSASSYGHTAIAECYPPLDFPREGPCWVCNNCPSQTDVLQRITPNRIQSLDNLAFLPKDSYMPSTQDVGSSILVCSLGAALIVGAWVNSLHGYQLPNWTSCDYATFQLYSFPVEPSPECPMCRNAPRYSPALLSVYFGTNEVKLSAVSGKTTAHSKEHFTNPATESHLESSRRRFGPCTHLGEEYSTCYVPGIPAADLEVSVPPPGCFSSLPDVLHKPLLKTCDGTIIALRSGGRSAILPAPDACYRLKGCGNYLDKEGERYPFPGFPLQKLEAKEGVEIRGCCFTHTAANGQHMTRVAADILKQEDIPAGNIPVAVWLYNIPEEPFPEVEKCCGVFETRGERRLSSHLLKGLEAMLPCLFPTITLEQVLSLFQPERLNTTAEGEAAVVQPTWSACCTGGKEKCSPINMCTTPLLETPPTKCPGDLHPQMLGTWCRAAFKLRQTLPLSEDDTIRCGSLTALLYWRLGWEVGAVKRLLEASDFSWGYFFDHNPFEPHCNSHPNNFIVLPPGSGKLLAPVDFDISFARQGFFSPYTGCHDDDLFDSWMASEHTEMERALGGEQVNTGVIDNQKNEQHSSPAHSALAWAFRDTLLSAYRLSYHGSPNPHPLPDRMNEAMESVVTMALSLTASNTS